MRRHGIRFVIALSSVILALFVSAGSASASSRTYIYWYGIESGYGQFDSYGDWWSACDTRSDGYGVRVLWRVPATGRTGSVADSGGNDGICTFQNVDIGEGRQVRYQVCLQMYGEVFACRADETIDYA